MKHSDQLMVKITPNIIKSLGDLKYFNTTPDAYKATYSNGTSNYITKDDFDGVQVIFCKVLKQI